MKDPGDGIHAMAREDYYRLDRANWSTLKHLSKSPLHYQHAKANGTRDSGPKKFGRATHLAVLEPERYRSEVVIWEDGDRRGNAWKAFKAKYAGLEILKPDEHQRCMALQTAARSAAMAAPYLSKGRSEITVLWTYRVEAQGGLPGFSIPCKSRIDFETATALVDLKSTRNASPDGFGKECWNYGYTGQAAFYADAYFTVTGKRLPYVLVALENTEPHVVQVYDIPEVYMELGRETYRALLARLHLCRSENRWPGYSDAKLELQLPKWAAPSADEDVTGLDLDMEGTA